MEPLAYKMRPQKFADIVGQDHLVGPNGNITKMILKGVIPSIILYGNPGIGKTTIAFAIVNELNSKYETFNASTDNKAKLKKIVDDFSDIPNNTIFDSVQATTNKTNSIIIVDEIHRMKKDIQDYLLPYVEKGIVTLIGITTINPYHSVNPAIRSRCMVFKLNTLTMNDLQIIFNRSLSELKKDLCATDEARNYIINMANGEVRSMINMIESIYFALKDDEYLINLELAKSIVLKPNISFDKNEDNYYDTLSALHKSIRGSDADASIHYLAMLLSAEDFLPLIRRLYCICYEDISLANPSMGPKVKAACEAALELGMPEARLPLASIVIEMALSPKSNSSLIAIDKALQDIENGKAGYIPLNLKNLYSFDEKQTQYKYPHDYPGAWVNQQYLPDSLINEVYYIPKETSKYELALKERLDAIKKAKNRK